VVAYVEGVYTALPGLKALVRPMAKELSLAKAEAMVDTSKRSRVPPAMLVPQAMAATCVHVQLPPVAAPL